MKKIALFSTFYLLISINAFSQKIEKDSVLYLLFDRDKYYFYEFKGKDQITNEPNPERAKFRYPYEYSLYNGHTLAFLSYKNYRSDTVSLHLLDHIPILSIEQLADRIGYFGAEYFRQLNEIYLVEKFPKRGIASITKVRLDIIIE